MDVEVAVREVNVSNISKSSDGATLYTGTVVIEAYSNPASMVNGPRFTIDFVRVPSLDEAADFALQRLSSFAEALQKAITP